MHFQTCCRISEACSFSCILNGCQRRAVPTACDLGEEPVLNRIELGTIRRVMYYHYIHSNSIGQIHKVLLYNSMRAGIGTPPSQKRTIVRTSGYMSCRCSCHTLYIGADKFRGVMITPDCEVAGGEKPI